MKHALISALGLFAIGCASTVFADTNTVASVNAAVAKLAAAPNYGWTVNVQLPNSQFTPSPVTGVTEKDGYSMVSEDINGDTMQAVFKGDKAAIKGQDDWQSMAEADDQTAMMGGFLVNPGTAATESAKILKDAGDLSAGTNGVISGDFTDAGATDQMTFRGRNGNPPPPPKNAKGSLKFWLNSDGTLAKFETHLTAQVAFGDQGPQDFEVIRTVVIQNVGTTKVTVPDAALKALQSKAAPAK